MDQLEQIISSINDIRAEQARLSEQVKGALKRIDEQKTLAESVHKIATSVEILALSQKQIETKVDSLSADIDEIKAKPGKRLDDIMWTILTVIITAIVTFIISRIGLG